jgi:hypothetical protein
MELFELLHVAISVREEFQVGFDGAKHACGEGFDSLSGD